MLWEEGHTTEISEIEVELLFNEFFGEWTHLLLAKPNLFLFSFQAKAVWQSGTEDQSLNTVFSAAWFWSRAQACHWQHSQSQQGDLVRRDRATHLPISQIVKGMRLTALEIKASYFIHKGKRWQSNHDKIFSLSALSICFRPALAELSGGGEEIPLPFDQFSLCPTAMILHWGANCGCHIFLGSCHLSIRNWPETKNSLCIDHRIDVIGSN